MRTLSSLEEPGCSGDPFLVGDRLVVADGELCGFRTTGGRLSLLDR